jgi:hypothetical protein
MANAPSPNDLTRQQLDELDALLQRMLAAPQARPAEPAAAAPSPVPLPDPTPAEPTPDWRTDRPAGSPPKAPHLTAAPAAVPEPAEATAIPRANPFAFAPTPGAPVPAVPASIALPPEAKLSPPFPSGPPVGYAPAGPPPTPAVPFEPAELVTSARLFGPPTPETGVPPSAPDPVAFDPVPLDPPAKVKTSGTAGLPEFGPIELPDVKSADPAPTPLVSVAEPEARGPAVPAFLWPLFAVNWVVEKLLGLFGPPGQALASPGMKHLLGGVGVVLLIAAGLWTARGMGWIQFPLPMP